LRFYLPSTRDYYKNKVTFPRCDKAREAKEEATGESKWFKNTNKNNAQATGEPLLVGVLTNTRGKCSKNKTKQNNKQNKKNKTKTN
jgi:hypothetical protein